MKRDRDQSTYKEIFSKLIQDLEFASAAEFCLPDWLKNKRTMPYVFIKRNAYLTKKIKKRTGDDGIFCFCSPNSSTGNVCGKDCHCGLLLSCCSSSCKCGSSCLNKPFQHRPVKKMKLVQTEKCGLGLIADEDIMRGEFVIEYVGEVIDDKTCEERLWRMKHLGETNFYLCEINRDTVIDATYKGNRSRFINHSCQPNTELQKWSVDGETRIGIFASHDIKRGEELTYDYRFIQFGADQDCHCGASGCRRTLGIKPSKQKLPSPERKMKFVASEMAAASTPVLKALMQRKVHECHGQVFENGPNPRKVHDEKCIGKLIKIWRPLEHRCYIGCIAHFSSTTGEHTVIMDNRERQSLDMSKEIWDFL